MEAMNNSDETSDQLKALNSKEVHRLIPTIVYMLTIAFVGIIGNSLVIHIYRTRYKQSNSKSFILCLSAVDLFTCCASIPLEVSTIFEQYMFQHVWLCKLSRSFNTFGTCASAFILLFIAIDRYRKVCRPFAKQIRNTIAKFLCVLSIVLAVLMSLPAVFIYGKHSFEISEFNITGTECSTSDAMQGKPFPFISSLIFGALFITQIICMSVLYCCIGHEVKKHARKMHKMSKAMERTPKSSIVEAMDSRISGELVSETPNAKCSIVKAKNKDIKRKRNESLNAFSEDSWTDKRDFELSANSKDVKEPDRIKESTQCMKRDKGDDAVDTDNNFDSDDSGIKVKDDNDPDADPKKTVEVTTGELEEVIGDQSKSGNGVDVRNLTLQISVIDEDSEMSINDSPIVYSTLNANEKDPDICEKENTYGRSLSLLSRRISQAFIRLASVVTLNSESNEKSTKRTQFLKQARARKTALLMFAITVAFIISFLPHLVLMIVRQVKTNFVDNLSEDNIAVYKLILRSYFLNCAINPIIYSVWDSRFRACCKSLFFSCFKCFDR